MIYYWKEICYTFRKGPAGKFSTKKSLQFIKLKGEVADCQWLVTKLTISHLFGRVKSWSSLFSFLHWSVWWIFLSPPRSNNNNGRTTMNEDVMKMYLLLKMVIFQLVILVLGGVNRWQRKGLTY